MLIVTSICLTLLILEIGVRFLPPPYPAEAGEFFACDNTLGWRGQPNFQGEIGNDLFSQSVAFNSLGMHDTEHPLPKPANTFRILMLGDSFVHAVQVTEAETAHQVLETRLNQANPSRQVEVISAGVTNWGTNQQLIFYQEQGRQFAPDLVLLMVYLGNDLLDNLPGNGLTIKGRNCYAPYFSLCDGQFNPTPLTYAPGLSGLDNNCTSARRAMLQTAGWVYQHSRLYQRLEPLLVANRPRRQFGLTYASPFSALYLPTEEIELEQAWRLTLSTITQLQQEVEADGSRLAVALISPEIVVRLAQLSPAERETFLVDNPAFAAAELDRPTRRLSEFLSERNLPVIDLLPPFISQGQSGAQLYIPGEWHWTEAGNRVAAEVLATWIERGDWGLGD